jgi:hypothetical protein
MAQDNIINFPLRLRDAIDDEQWQQLQGEFYIDCYKSQHGQTPEHPDQLRDWLQQAQLFADMDNPFFRGWLMRRLSEQQ